MNLNSPIGSRVAAIAGVLALLITGSAPAQELRISDLQKNVDIFAGVLAEALDLEQATGLFGISLGGIDSTYLYGQGVVLEVRTALSNRRNTMSLASLNSTLQNLQSRTNPFAALAQTESVNSAEPPSLSLTAMRTEADDFYSSMMDRIANVDYSIMVNSAIQQASEYARSLRSLEGVDDATYQSLRIEIDSLRQEMQDSFASLRKIESDVQNASLGQADTAAQLDQSEMQLALESVLNKLEPLRDRAVAKAEELRERSRLAEIEYTEKWRQQVAEFESQLVAAMCDYGSTLHELPESENVSVILTGLGESAANDRRADKVHVFSKRDLLECQAGNIDQQTLQQRSAQYSY